MRTKTKKDVCRLCAGAEEPGFCTRRNRHVQWHLCVVLGSPRDASYLRAGLPGLAGHFAKYRGAPHLLQSQPEWRPLQRSLQLGLLAGHVFFGVSAFCVSRALQHDFVSEHAVLRAIRRVYRVLDRLVGGTSVAGAF